MRVHILSDLHLEFGDYAPEQTGADVVILAGDIHVGCHGIKWVKEHFPEQSVIYVLGNHEFYHHSISGVFKEFGAATGGGNICLLENQSVQIGGFTFLGCTLWTDFKLWPNAGTAMLAHGNSPTRGKYAKNLQGTVEYLVRCATPTGLLTGASQDGGQPMHGHGFALMFLACAYGTITKESLRQKVQAAVRKAVTLTSQGQSAQGGWTYIPGAGDEGSVTVTQVQALRAAHNAGFLVPKAVIEEAVRYLERCRTPEGGIQYSLLSGGGPRLPISAAAV